MGGGGAYGAPSEDWVVTFFALKIWDSGMDIHCTVCLRQFGRSRFLTALKPLFWRNKGYFKSMAGKFTRRYSKDEALKQHN